METPRARYQQIADELREAIRQGVYEPGDRLPSHPDLSKQYGVSRTWQSRQQTFSLPRGWYAQSRGAASWCSQGP